MADNINTIKKIFDAETIAASHDSESRIIDLDAYTPRGYYSAEIKVTGDGTAKVEY